MTQTLQTSRLTLRRFEVADEADLFELDNDPAVMRFITGGSNTPRDVIRKQILPLFIRESDEQNVCGFWAAELRTEARFIGWFCLREISGLPGQASLGYRLCRDAWGQGLATEGARLLLEQGFHVKQFDRILATTYEENAASIAVMQHLGMRFHREFRLDASDLAAADTSAQNPDNAFPGNDVEYCIDRASWLGCSSDQIG